MSPNPKPVAHRCSLLLLLLGQSEAAGEVVTFQCGLENCLPCATRSEVDGILVSHVSQLVIFFLGHSVEPVFECGTAAQ